MADRKHYTFDEGVPVPSVTTWEKLPRDARPREGDTASGLDDAGRLFIWTYRAGKFQMREAWTTRGADRCLAASRRTIVIAGCDPCKAN